MSAKSILQRLDRMKPVSPRALCVTQRAGESDLAVNQRAAALGYPVTIVQATCETSEEWVRAYGPTEGSR